MRVQPLFLLAIIHLPVAALPAWCAVRYVDVNNGAPAAPYTNWSTAANVIQVAIDASQAGDLILVTNGVYQSGGHNYANDVVNRVALPVALTVASVNGPAATTILGDVYPHYAFGARCAYLAEGAVLAGFTLSLGKATLGHNTVPNRCGGAIFCTGGSAVVSNCVISQSTSASHGGGGYQVTYINCVFKGNSSGGYGGGATYATLINCTLAGNSAYVGGGVNGSTLKNCIICFNGAQISGMPPDCYSSGLLRCCTTGVGNENGNFSGDPLFVDAGNGDFHLQTNSPCINAGDNTAAPADPDLDGNPRVAGGAVDMGAYEFQAPASLISYAWLRQYGLAVDGSADFLDSDRDGMNN